jgi:DNA polymerase III delta prime subunit
MSESINWLEKYRPKTFKEYLNYIEYKPIVEKWIKPFLNKSNITDKPFLILHGPPSYGKTTLAHCIFNEYGYVPLECNASDTRNKSQIEKLIKTGKYSFEVKDDGSGFKPYGLILDELDGLTSGDNGGVDTIMNIAFLTNDKIVKNNEYHMRYPIICTTNSIKEKKLLPILRFGELINMSKPSSTALFNLGKEIIKKEKIPITQKLLKEFIKPYFDYRLLINELNMIYFDIKKYTKLTDKKKRIIEIVNNSIDNKIELKINNSNIYEIAQNLIIDLNKYNKKKVLNVIDANNLVFYFTMITNYYIFLNSKIKSNININKLITELINNFYIGNKYLELFKKNKSDNHELIKYINYIISYGSIYLINSSITDFKSIKLSYHTKYNDMKQDKSYFFNNIQYKFNISNKLSNKTKLLLYNKNIITKKKNKTNQFILINNNDKIFNNIIDLDILFLYNNLEYISSDFNINKTIIKKLKKYIS